MVDITNVVNVSVATRGRALGFYNVNNVMLLSDETPIESFGTDVFRAYTTATAVKNDFGSDSKTYKIALKIFSQQPNLLAGGGQLLIAPMETATIPATSATGTIVFAGNPSADSTITCGSDTLTFGTEAGEDVILIGETLADTLANIASVSWADVIAVSNGENTITFTAKTAGTAGNNLDLACSDTAVAVASGETLEGGTDEQDTVEQLNSAISRVYDKVYFGGVITSKYISTNEGVASAELMETLNTILLLASNNVSDMEENGMFGQIINAGYTKTKCLLYTVSQADAYLMTGAYAGRAFATNYNGSNTCMTMNLKDLIGITADTGITQTVYNQAKALGVDLYTDYEGIAKVVSNSGKVGQYFDQIINRLWFTQTLKVEYFNALATVGTKIPQTEVGMSILDNAIKRVCDKAIYNGFGAKGLNWNSADTFGNQDDFLRNITSEGYYIYHTPVVDQTQAEREERKAPVSQIALKESGAIHSGDLIVNFEA